MQLSWQSGHLACDAWAYAWNPSLQEVEAGGCSESEAALAWKSHHFPDLQNLLFSV